MTKKKKTTKADEAVVQGNNVSRPPIGLTICRPQDKSRRAAQPCPRNKGYVFIRLEKVPAKINEEFTLFPELPL